MFGMKGIEAVKFAPGVLGVEAPVDGGLGCVAFLCQGMDFPPENLLIGEPLLLAGTGQRPELDFRHVQPNARPQRIIAELQPFVYPPSLVVTVQSWGGALCGNCRKDLGISLTVMAWAGSGWESTWSG